MTIKHLVLSFFFFISLFLIGVTLYRMTHRSTVLASSSQLPHWSESYLGSFDGTDPNKPIYIGMNGYVYDVSTGKEFYAPGGPYHYLAGHDSSSQLNLFGGKIVARKYPIVAVLKSN